ncbi:two-component system regulatory protein YycI [Fervidibacillus halotolerans]|uniref:Two-component system regulatory protein YycI n=1 Tax=Fervidibacillus halotolerans TaxID=2980027 RepID=A0A9E8RYI2_9BACI|nr:two-component system regulatory protein YycI [Fervidibacillus halotolerans]WAA12273.1 two-component system regulatory protein YycI [Fervidibacillus halotolerans]
MDWSRAKTIFIFTFLILNVFLLFRLIQLETENKNAFIQETSMEERLLADDIEVPELPQEPKKEYYVEATAKTFHRNDMEDLSGQEITIVSENVLESNLSIPFQLNDDWKQTDVDLFVFNHIYQGNQYTFWDYDPEKRQIIYYQNFKNKTFYKNKNAAIILQLDQNGNIDSYSQTMLDNIKEIKEQDIFSAKQALLILYNKQYIQSGSKITDVALGYYTLVPAISSQLLVPTWRFEINGEKNLFVNAVEGSIFQETGEANERMQERDPNAIP